MGSFIIYGDNYNSKFTEKSPLIKLIWFSFFPTLTVFSALTHLFFGTSS